MRTKRLIFGLAVGLVLAGPTGVAGPLGQTPTAHAEPDARAIAAHVDALVVAMDASSEHVRRLLRKARVQKWPRGVACLDEALSRVDVALRVAREEARGAREAAHGGDVDRARAHLSRVTRLREMARAGAAGGEMCAAGPEFQAFEGTTVRVIVDASIAPVTPATPAAP